MLLIIEALLISAVLGQDHRTDDDEEQIFPLDMEENSVDDVFVGCKMNMSDQVKTELLEKELNNSPIFKTVWQRSKENATIPVYDNLTLNHSVAIYVYTNSHFDLHQDFNNAVSADKQKYENKIFTWYSLYFLLAEAIQILKEVQNVCKLTYRGTDVEFDNNVLNKEVRFGRFASSSLDRTVATLFGNKSCFEIKTCEGADVKYYSTFPEEEEVLIPPYEKFKVTDIMKIEDRADLWCDTVYKLESTGIRSDLNCAFFRNQAETSQTSAFNNNAFCRCFQRKLRTLHSRYRINQSVQFLGKLQGCFSQHQLRRHRVYPTGREIHSDTHSWPYPLRGHRHDPTDPDIHSANQLNQRWLCYRSLHSLRIDHKILALLKPCCRV
ncbi:ecto-ADP-ribosyltransferase 5-like [Pimephales promelas]|uniref:ecto-ADP-ribosyltransferase 5-like n=1 Tax=Pimephales promelas TaxID=90988 RepID=UPI0019559101|nr:ecto-ADP-ribosyltransferase 5-like [Pimephales promelas]